MNSPTTSKRWALSGAGALACLLLALGLQSLFGNDTIYRPGIEGERLKLHRMIIERPQGVDWAARGARSTGLRVAVPWTVEGLHRAFGWPVMPLYRALATATLAASLWFVFVLLRRFHDQTWAGGGVLLFAAAMIPTYRFHYFHPWDRPGLLIWLLFFWAALQRKFPFAAALLAVGMLVKFDFLFGPLLIVGLYGLAAWRTTALLSLITGGLFAGLSFFLAEPNVTQVGLLFITKRNFMHLAEHHLWHPAVLVLLPLAVFAALGFKKAPRTARVLGLFAAAHIPIFVFTTNFRELRAQTFMVAAAFPLALFGLRSAQKLFR